MFLSKLPTLILSGAEPFCFHVSWTHSSRQATFCRGAMTEAPRSFVGRAPSPPCCRLGAPQFGPTRAHAGPQAPPGMGAPRSGQCRALTASGPRVSSAQLSGASQLRRRGRSWSACGALPAVARGAEELRAGLSRSAAGRSGGTGAAARPGGMGPAPAVGPSSFLGAE